MSFDSRRWDAREGGGPPQVGVGAWGEPLSPDLGDEIARLAIASTHALETALGGTGEGDTEVERRAEGTFACKALGARVTNRQCANNALNNLGQPCGLDCSRGWGNLMNLGGLSQPEGGSDG